MISGLNIQYEAITPDTETDLVERLGKLLESVPQTGTTERSRILRFGYDYTPEKKKLEDAPPWIYPMASLFEYESVLVNEYGPGRGMGVHTDAPQFGDTIISLSLNDDCTMIFRKGVEEARYFLPRRTMLTMQGDCRHNWSHEITGDHKHTRISLVYRKRID